MCPCSPHYHWVTQPAEITSKISEIISPFDIEELERDQRNYTSLRFGCVYLMLGWFGNLFGALIYIGIMVALFAMDID